MHDDDLYRQWRITIYGAKSQFNDFLVLNGFQLFAKDIGSNRHVYTYKNKTSTEVALIVINHNSETYNYTLEVKSTNNIHESAYEIVEQVKVEAEKLAQAYKELNLFRALNGE